MRRPSACKPRLPRPLPQALPELPLPFTAQVGLSGPSHETCSGHSPADITLCLCRVCAQSCLTLCSPMDCSPQGSSVHGVFQASHTGVGCHFLLQTQGWNLRLLCLLRWQVGSLLLAPPGSPDSTLAQQIFTPPLSSDQASCQEGSGDKRPSSWLP